MPRPGRTATPSSPQDPATGAARLPLERLEPVAGFGRVGAAPGYVYRPSTVAGVREVMALAAESGVPLTLRGAGRSYGDAALRPEALVLDLTRMQRILAWDPATGVLDAEPGVTIRDVWRFALGDGWWPAVVPGTMAPTLGGCLAMNVHGKNNWARGTVGDHCLELDVLLPAGGRRTISREREAELFHAVIGSFGQLAVLTRVRWQLKKVSSGLLEVRAEAVPDLEAMLRLLDDSKDRYEYVVGWVDAFPGGRKLGRGQVHFARMLEPGEDPDPAQSLRLEAQGLPETLFGVVPRAILWRLMQPWTNRAGMRWVNASKALLARTVQDGAVYRQSLAAYQFLLDYVPGWERAYEPGGLIQHQSFVPRDAALAVFRGQLETCRKAGLPSFLAVMKRHRPDPFLLSHAVDGFSLALDFPVTRSNQARLWALVRELAEPVVAAGGRFYPAKDAALPAELFQASFREGQLERFSELKARTDPGGLLTSALAERLLGASSPSI